MGDECTGDEWGGEDVDGGRGHLALGLGLDGGEVSPHFLFVGRMFRIGLACV